MEPGQREPKTVSIIIPLGPGEAEWPGLIADLERAAPVARGAFFARVEALWIVPDRGFDRSTLEHGLEHLRRAGIETAIHGVKAGRARQLNAGAAVARGAVLWFVHADTRFDPGVFEALAESFGRHRGALRFFDLRFYDGPRTMKINTVGAWVRSRVLGLPFGDQGFSLEREVFARIGGFDESLPREEDHDFVWRARRLGIALSPIASVVRTSARRYRDQGWLKVTALYGYLTFRRAVPEALNQLFSRLERPNSP